MKLLRNLLIVALIALVITVVPGGGTARDTVLSALTMAFLAVIGWFGYRLHQENRFSIEALSDAWRAVLYGCLGLVVFLIAGFDQMWGNGAGTLAWIALMVLAVLGLVQVFRETRGGYV